MTLKAERVVPTLTMSLALILGAFLVGLLASPAVARTLDMPCTWRFL